MYKFPFDTQICSLDFGNLVHTEYAVQLYTDMDSVLMSFFVPSKEFRYGLCFWWELNYSVNNIWFD